MADREDLRDYARSQTHLDSADVADATINTYLDRAVQIVASRFDWPFLEASTTFDTVVDQHNYSVPADWVKTIAIVQDGKKTRLREIGPVQAWTRYGDDPPSGTARAFYLYGNGLYLVEKPTAVLTYHHYYLKEPTLMTLDTSTPEWNDNHHYFLAEYAIQQMWLAEEDLQQANQAAYRFEQGLAEMAQFYINQAVDSPIVWGEDADRIVSFSRTNLPWLDGV